MRGSGSSTENCWHGCVIQANSKTMGSTRQRQPLYDCRWTWQSGFAKRDFQLPDSIVPDPNGGIVFERREGKVSEVLHVWDDGSAEYMRFRGTQLVERQPLSRL